MAWFHGELKKLTYTAFPLVNGDDVIDDLKWRIKKRPQFLQTLKCFILLTKCNVELQAHTFPQT